MRSSFTWSTATSEPRLGGASLAVRVSRRARRLRLSVDPRGAGLVLTVPAGVSRRRALAWAATHEAWAEQALRALPAPVPLVPGNQVPLAGDPHLIVASPGPRGVRLEPGRILVGGPEEQVEARLLRWLRAEALAVLTAETKKLAERLGVPLAAVGVGDPRSRWGSCSSGGTIRYSWRLVMAPDFVRRATVAHEAAHLVHMNHGAAFHALVAELLGADPSPARAWLRAHGRTLHAVGARAA